MNARREDGFSLTEVAIAGVLVMVLAIPMLRFFDSAVGGAAELQTSTQLQSDARLALDGLVRELRQAYTGTPALAPATVAPQQLEFYSPDTDTPYRLRRISYRIQNSELQRSVTWSDAAGGPPWAFSGTAGPWSAVMAVESGTFTAVPDDDGLIRQVDIDLTGPNSRGRADRTFRTSVTLRNVQ